MNKKEQIFDKELTKVLKRFFADLLYVIKIYGSKKTFFSDMQKIINAVKNVEGDLEWIYKIHGEVK